MTSFPAFDGDYTVWRDGLGATFTSGDYNVWVANYGATAATATLTVPEPSAGLLVIFACSFAWRRSRAA